MFHCQMTVSTVISYIKEIVHWQVLLTALLLDFSALLQFSGLQFVLFSSVLGPPPFRKYGGAISTPKLPSLKEGMSLIPFSYAQDLAERM